MVLDHATLPSLWRHYASMPRQLAFRASDVAGWATWREELRTQIAALLGGFPAQHPPLDAVTLEDEETPDYRLEKVAFQSEPDVWTPCYVLTPRGVTPPYRPVIALHGHGIGGAAHLVGRVLHADLRNQEEAHIARHNYDYASKLARHGFMVFVPEQRGLGQRMESWPHAITMDDGDVMWSKSCRSVALNALLLGKTLLGLRVLDVMRTVDYIASRDEETAGGLGCLGLSGGGTTTLFAAALDERITVAVVSGYLNTFRDSIMPIPHCECNYVPGILRYAEMSDVAGLIAPRPVHFESGTLDPIFPIQASVAALGELKRVYDLLNVPERLQHDVFEGEHQFSGRQAFTWLDKWLG